MRTGEQEGFTYLSALLLIVTIGAGLAGLGEAWSQRRQREKEAELIWVGNQFRQAIGAYYEHSPGSVKNYPEKLDDLLEDPRYLFTLRHLRRIYVDPMTGRADWILDPAPIGGFMGIHSSSTGQALRTVNLKRNYTDWRFMYEPEVLPRRP